MKLKKRLLTTFNAKTRVYSHYARKGRVRKGWDSVKGSGKGKKGPQVFSHVVANTITCTVVP